jgi:hypothetical protein
VPESIVLEITVRASLGPYRCIKTSGFSKDVSQKCLEINNPRRLWLFGGGRRLGCLQAIEIYIKNIGRRRNIMLAASGTGLQATKGKNIVLIAVEFHQVPLETRYAQRHDETVKLVKNLQDFLDNVARRRDVGLDGRGKVTTAFTLAMSRR